MSVILTVWSFLFGRLWQSFSTVHQLLTAHKRYHGYACAEENKNQISATRQMESEGIFLRWWHFSSLLYCDHSFDNTCPCFWQEKNFVVAVAELIKKPQRSTVCHGAQRMGGAAVNRAVIIWKVCEQEWWKIDRSTSGIWLELLPCPWLESNVVSKEVNGDWR